MLISPIPTHEVLPDMPSSSNTDHDGRYVPYSSLSENVYTFDTASLTLTGGTLSTDTIAAAGSLISVVDDFCINRTFTENPKDIIIFYKHETIKRFSTYTSSDGTRFNIARYDNGGTFVDNALAILRSDGSATFTNSITDGAASSFTTGTTIGNLTFADGSITDSGGTIDFGDENLTTTGNYAITGTGGFVDLTAAAGGGANVLQTILKLSTKTVGSQEVIDLGFTSGEATFGSGYIKNNAAEFFNLVGMTEGVSILSGGVDGRDYRSVRVRADGTYLIGDGAGATDTSFARTGVAELTITDNLITLGTVEAQAGVIIDDSANAHKLSLSLETGSDMISSLQPRGGNFISILEITPSGSEAISSIRLLGNSARADAPVLGMTLSATTATIFGTNNGGGASPSKLTIALDLDVSGNLIVNDNAVAGDGLTLKGGGVAGAQRGGIITWMKNATAIAGYTFANTDNRFVFQDFSASPPQGNPGDDANAWIDFDDGSASFATGNFTISTSGFVVATGLDVIGVTQLGDGGTTDYAQFAADGELTLFGTARVLRSVDFEPDAVKKGGVGPADSTEDGFPIHDYDSTNDESVHIHWEIPHDYASAEEIHLHVEFFVDTAPGAAANVTWGVEYKKLSIGDNFDFGAGTTTVIVNTALTTGTPANDKKIHSSAQIQLVTTGFEPMDVVLIRIFRDADASEVGATDNFGSDARVFNYHLMYLSDKLGEAA